MTTRNEQTNPGPLGLQLRATSRALLALAVLMALGSATGAGAQDSDKQFEITPYVSYLFGGSFDLFDSEFGRVDFELDEDTAFGVGVGIPITRSVQIELSYLKQDTELQIDEGLFNEEFTVAGIEIDTFLAGVLIQGSYGQARPFFSAGLGIADLSLDVPGTDNEVKPAAYLGGGVKTMFNRHLGMRFEGRVLIIVIEDDDDDRFRRRYDDAQTITQGQLTAGLIWAF